MKTIVMSAVCAFVLFVACNKKDPQAEEPAVTTEKEELVSSCGKEFVTDKPVKVGETGILLPIGTKFCISSDNLEVRLELPLGFAFLSRDKSAIERTLPVYGTYACYCSTMGSACNVFYADGMGFGCFQSSCMGSCTGKFTYKGYSLDRVINLADKSSFFQSVDIQQEIKLLTKDVSPLEAYGKFSIMGVPFFLVQDEKAFLEKAICDCEGTQACKLKVITLPVLDSETIARKIYYCDGSCGGCELTIH